MVNLLAWLLLLLPTQALGAELVIPTEPSRVEIQRVKRYRVAYGFHQDESRRFSVLVKVIYRNTYSRIERVKDLILPVQRGMLIQQDAKTLVLRLGNRELAVGKHRWWYSPYWQPGNNVRIACDHSKRLHRVVIENCRLIIQAGPDSNAS